MTTRITLTPHPSWATHAMQGFPSEQICREHGQIHAPGDFGVRCISESNWEWFFPEQPARWPGSMKRVFVLASDALLFVVGILIFAMFWLCALLPTYPLFVFMVWIRNRICSDEPLSYWDFTRDWFTFRMIPP